MALDLTAYDVDRERGFLPRPDPIARLPAELAAWDQVGDELPKILMSDRVRARLADVPLLDPCPLASDAERRRAMTILSFVGHAYVWGEEPPARSIPPCIARPWHELARLLGRPPVLSYASYALDNWRRLDPERPIELGNIALLQNFLGGQDEEWFVLVHVAIEARAGEALAAIVSAQEAVAADRPEVLTAELEVVARTLEAMHAILLRMPERCDPYIYFHRVRPYLHGWSDHPGVAEGVVYEGVVEYAGKLQRFRGETGAQSSIVPALDAALGVRHAEDALRRYLIEMLDYMPPRHRAFIDAVERGGSIRRYVLDRCRSHPALTEAYNRAVGGVERFRSIHFDYVRSYIMKQDARRGANPNTVGTGGTPFGGYLRKHRDETRRHRITVGD